MSETAEAPAQTIELPTATPVATQEARLYTYSSWVHVGPNAHNCEGVNEEAGTNECSDPLHFHAWMRLANQFQHRDIRELAMAAKARRARQLRNEGTDSFEILEAELDALLRMGDEGKKALVDELVGKDWLTDYIEATRDVRDQEETQGEETVKPFEHVDADRERFLELSAIPEDERPPDEFRELEEHLEAFARATEARLKAIVEPKHAALSGLELDKLVGMVRDQRIEAGANEEFMHVYSMHSWLECTLRTPRGERVFKSLEALHQSAPEVIFALKETYDDLEASERGAGGNS